MPGNILGTRLVQPLPMCLLTVHAPCVDLFTYKLLLIMHLPPSLSLSFSPSPLQALFSLIFTIRQRGSRLLLSSLQSLWTLRMPMYMYCPLLHLRHRSLDNKLSIILCYEWLGTCFMFTGVDS